MTLEEKIMYLESLTRRHFVPYQWVDDGLLEYFEMLRRGENDKFLDDVANNTPNTILIQLMICLTN